MSYFTPDEKTRLSFEPFAPGDPRCYVCGARKSSTDSGCCGVDGEQYECPRW